MRIDNFGQRILSGTDLIDLIMKDPERVIKTTLVEPDTIIDNALDLDNFPKLKIYQSDNITLDQFHQNNQQNWYMPYEYKTMDIANHLLSLCKTEAELQRVGQELIKFQERDMFALLKYLKYLVDLMRKNNIVWGVGRGSSVASYCLYLLGVHKINSMYYDLDISEFLK